MMSICKTSPYCAHALSERRCYHSQRYGVNDTLQTPTANNNVSTTIALNPNVQVFVPSMPAHIQSVMPQKMATIAEDSDEMEPEYVQTATSPIAMSVSVPSSPIRQPPLNTIQLPGFNSQMQRVNVPFVTVQTPYGAQFKFVRDQTTHIAPPTYFASTEPYHFQSQQTQQSPTQFQQASNSNATQIARALQGVAAQQPPAMPVTPVPSMWTGVTSVRAPLGSPSSSPLYCEVTDDSDTSMSVSDHTDIDANSVHSACSGYSSNTSNLSRTSPTMPPTPMRPPRGFQARYNNHAKGNFYISPADIKLMTRNCIECFHTDIRDDEKAAFGYFKESVAMQINDHQIRIHHTSQGDVIVIDIDLHFKPKHSEHKLTKMYLVAMENDSEFVDKVSWCIKQFLAAHEIYRQYGIDHAELPRSSRDNAKFQNGLCTVPVNVPLSVLDKTHFKKLPAKNSKRRCCTLESCKCKAFVLPRGVNANELSVRCELCGHSAAEHGCDAKDTLLPRIWIKGREGQQRMKERMRASWNARYVVPVVVIKGKQTWIEWKKFVEVDANAWVAISLSCYNKKSQRYNARSWKIECLDFDSGRIYYQHRLVGRVDRRFDYRYAQLAPLVTTTLEFCR